MGEIDFFHVFYVIRFLEVNFGLPSFTTFLLLTLNLIGVFVQVSQLGGFRRINFAHLLIWFSTILNNSIQKMIHLIGDNCSPVFIVCIYTVQFTLPLLKVSPVLQINRNFQWYWPISYTLYLDKYIYLFTLLCIPSMDIYSVSLIFNYFPDPDIFSG